MYINTQDRRREVRYAERKGVQARLIAQVISGGKFPAALDEVGSIETNSRKLIRMLEKDGWVLERVSGDHHTFKHPDRESLITVTHPRRDLPVGLVRRIYKLAGWRP